MQKLTEPRLKASDLRDVLGLTYRQINDWDSRGILQTYRNKSESEKPESWRRFSISDLIPLAILVELKQQGIPVSKLLEVTKKLFLGDEILYDFLPNIFYGIDTYFFTDFSTFTGYDCADPESGRIDLYIYDLSNRTMVLIVPLKPIVERLFTNLELSDFSTRLSESGHFDFTINGVPLKLEPLPKNPITEEVVQAQQDFLSKKKGD